MEEQAVRAFVPGHVTGFFSPHRTNDPASSGARGAGIALDTGVTVTVSPANRRSVVLNDDAVTVEPVTRVLDSFEVTATVEAETALPLGTGFGVSGAMALGTALAANQCFDGRYSENELVTVAHSAEVESDTGLGDVVAQARGGAPIRVEPGAPGHGLLDGVPAVTRVEYVTFGPMSTSDVLTGDTTDIVTAGDAALTELRDDPTLETFMAVSRRFARDAALLTPRVESVIGAVTETGGEAAMAMLGETVFALGTSLSDAGYDAVETAVHPPGATLR